MARFNLGNFLNKEVFNTREFKTVTNTIGNYSGKILNFGSSMMSNMLKLSNNLSNFMGTSYFPILLLSGVSLIVLWKLKII